MSWTLPAEDLVGPWLGWRRVRITGDVDIYVASRLSALLAEHLTTLAQVALVRSEHTASATASAGASAAVIIEHSQQSAAGLPQARGLVVDLLGMDFIDSAGLGVITLGAKRARANGVGYRLVSTSPLLASMLAMTGLDRVLRVHPDLGQADPVDPAG